MNQYNIFARLQQIMNCIWEVETANVKLPQVERRISDKEAEDMPASSMVIFGAPVLFVISWLAWGLLIPDAAGEILTAIPLLNLITKPLCWEAAWYITIPFQLILNGIIVYVIFKPIGAKRYRQVREDLKALEAEKKELLAVKEENEKMIGTTLEILPEFYRNYNSVVGIVAAYNLGWADDLQNAMSAYAMNQDNLADWADAAYQPLREVMQYNNSAWKEPEVPTYDNAAEESAVTGMSYMYEKRDMQEDTVTGYTVPEDTVPKNIQCARACCSEIMSRHLLYKQYRAMKKNR